MCRGFRNLKKLRSVAYVRMVNPTPKKATLLKTHADTNRATSWHARTKTTYHSLSEPCSLVHLPAVQNSYSVALSCVRYVCY
ncbi:MAG: hypothetical protein CO108_19855 [Deltaproteobacteria bacterium CG_4_9_14_3_um_filter_63_12]|nr:MAG: hypothetical protein CO108_19855 [Deltaproteobacteria bacterium CG_4_9_14_3_um_filter_63_12]